MCNFFCFSNKPEADTKNLCKDTANNQTDASSVPAPVLLILDTMGLPLALLPTLLAVYRDVRDTYKLMVMQGHCVSWSTMLSQKLKSAWPGTSLTTTNMNELVGHTLAAAGQANILLKTVSRPGPVIAADKIDVQLLQGRVATKLLNRRFYAHDRFLSSDTRFIALPLCNRFFNYPFPLILDSITIPSPY